MRRPLKDKRPLGPLVDPDFSSSDQEGEDTQQRVETQQENELDPITKQAEDWYNSISKQENKRKMMRNYLKSISELSDKEIQEKLDKAGL
jgi:hypothetical protein